MKIFDSPFSAIGTSIMAVAGGVAITVTGLAPIPASSKIGGEQGKIFTPSTTTPALRAATLTPQPLTLSATKPPTGESVLFGISHLPDIELGGELSLPSPTQPQNSPSSIVLWTTNLAPGLPPSPAARRETGVSQSVRATDNTDRTAQSIPPGNQQPPSSFQKTSALGNLNPSANPLLYPTKPSEVQVQLTKPITLQQALALAQRNNRDLQTATLTLERSQFALREAVAAEYPTLGLQTDLTRSDSANAELSTRSSPFGGQSLTSTTLNGALQLNYDVYTSGRRSATIRAAAEQARFDELDVERQSEQIRLDVTNAYYDLQQADAQVTIGEASVNEAQRSLRDAQLLERAGLGTEFDILRAQVQVSDANQTLTTARSQQSFARRRLVQLLSLAQTVEVKAADPIKPAGSWQLSLPQTIILALQNRAELQQQVARRNISEQQQIVALASERPQVNVFANYNLIDLYNDGTGPADGLSLGARLRWDFYDGGAARARAAQQRVNIAIAENQFADARNQVRLQVEQAYFNLNSNRENIQTAELALQQALRSLDLARLRFNAGVGNQTDVINAQSELTRARANRLQAIVDYNRSLASLQRAISNLSPRTVVNRR